MKRRGISLVLWVALCLTISLPVWASPTPTPLEAIQTSVDTVLGYLRDKGLDPATRRNAITQTIRKRFDFETMSRGTLARAWKKTSPDERKRFTALFTRLLEATYLGRIEAYTDERVEYVSQKIKGERALVNTVIKTNVDIPVDYKVRLRDGDWFVYDVVIEGVSLVRNYRGSYREIVHRDGIEGLLSQMEAKLGELETKDP